MNWFSEKDEINTSLLRLTFLDKSKKEYTDDLNAEILNNIFANMAENTGNIIFIDINHHNENDLQVEFGNNSCFISMGDEEEGEAYTYLNSDGDPDEFIDLIANSYPQNMLCHNKEHLFTILKTFIATGKPDSSFQWEITDM